MDDPSLPTFKEFCSELIDNQGCCYHDDSPIPYISRYDGGYTLTYPVIMEDDEVMGIEQIESVCSYFGIDPKVFL